MQNNWMLKSRIKSLLQGRWFDGKERWYDGLEIKAIISSPRIGAEVKNKASNQNLFA